MAMKEEELEFISVQDGDDDGNMTISYGKAPGEPTDDSVIGNWIFKQSKVDVIFPPSPSL